MRVKILYNYGGIYLDTDMEIIKDISPLLDTDMFLGYENENTMSFGIVGVIPKHKVFEKMYEFYQDKIWKSSLHIITNILTDILEEEYQGKYKQNNINIYPREYFYPFNHDEEFTETCIKKNTYAIHWWGKSWKKNPKVYFLKYKHLPWWKKHPKHIAKLINYYFNQRIVFILDCLGMSFQTARIVHNHSVKSAVSMFQFQTPFSPPSSPRRKR